MKPTLLLLLLLVTNLAVAQNPWYFGTGEAVNLTNGIRYNNTVKNISGSTDPTSVAVNAPAGSLYLRTNGALYVKQDAGSTTNWFPLSAFSGGIIPMANGGTDKALTPVLGGIVYTDAGSMEILPAGNAGEVFTSNGAAAPSWEAVASSIASINGETGPAITLVEGSAGTDFVISEAANTITFDIPSSSALNRGLLLAADWTTFNSKQAAGNYITALSGDVVATGPGAVAATIQPLAVDNGKIANSTINLTTKVTGILPVPNGGTGLASVTDDSLLIGNGVAALGEIARCADGEYLGAAAGAWDCSSIPAGGDVTGPGSSVDNHIATFDSTTGKIIQDNSTAVLSDAGALSGLTQLDIDNLRLDGNTLSSTDANGNILMLANGTGDVSVGAVTNNFYPSVKTTAERDALTPSFGSFVMNSTTQKLNFYDGSSWIVVDGIPQNQNYKTCIYSFGGASATITNLTECTTGTCVEVTDVCDDGTSNVASPPTWATVALYDNLTWQAGVWANDTSMSCTCAAFDASLDAPRGCLIYKSSGNQNWASDASGGYAITIRGTDGATTQTTIAATITCRGLAP